MHRLSEKFLSYSIVSAEIVSHDHNLIWAPKITEILEIPMCRIYNFPHTNDMREQQ